mmetsp:Transcript_63470/g.147928  ORF Transcript_63470/g.147928 Transcript_63470/m.147928 type:complete len:269 (-) Transcript_63470:331-1137(-)
MSTPGTRVAQIFNSCKRLLIISHLLSPKPGKLRTYTATLSLNHLRALSCSSRVQLRMAPCSGRSHNAGFSKGSKRCSAADGQKPWPEAMSWKLAQELCVFRFQWHIWLSPTQHQFLSKGYLSFLFLISQTRFQESDSSHVRLEATGIGAVTLQKMLLGLNAGKNPGCTLSRCRGLESSVSSSAAASTPTFVGAALLPSSGASRSAPDLRRWGSLMTVSRTWSCKYPATPRLLCGEVASTIARAVKRMKTPQMQAHVYVLLFASPFPSR